jgi:hypothetical protein
MEQTFYDRVARIPGGANRVDVDCRTTFCRVEVVSEHTCILIDSDDPEYTEAVGRQLTEHAMAEATIWRFLDYDGLTAQCDGEPGLYMTFKFDRVEGR